KILSDRFSGGLEVLRDVIANPIFDDSEIAMEKSTVLAEIRRMRDTMSARASELFYQACFGDAPYGLPASGIAETLETMGSSELKEWHERSMNSSGAIIGVVGNIGRSELENQLSNLLQARLSRLPVRPSTFSSPGQEID